LESKRNDKTKAFLSFFSKHDPSNELQFAKEGKVWKINKKGKVQERVLFLFNKFLLYTSAISQNKFSLKGGIFLHQCLISDVPQTAKIINNDKEAFSKLLSCGFQISELTSKRIYYFYCNTEDDKNQWKNVIQNIQNNNENDEKEKPQKEEQKQKQKENHNNKMNKNNNNININNINNNNDRQNIDQKDEALNLEIPKLQNQLKMLKQMMAKMQQDHEKQIKALQDKITEQQNDFTQLQKDVALLKSLATKDIKRKHAKKQK